MKKSKNRCKERKQDESVVSIILKLIGMFLVVAVPYLSWIFLLANIPTS